MPQPHDPGRSLEYGAALMHRGEGGGVVVLVDPAAAVGHKVESVAEGEDLVIVVVVVDEVEVVGAEVAEGGGAQTVVLRGGQERF